MSFRSILGTIGTDVKKVFAWVGTPQAQKIIVTAEVVGEAAANAIDPGLAVLDPLIQAWTQEVFKAQAMAVAAGASTGSGVQKAAIVASTMTPQVLAFAQTAGLPAPTAAEIGQANTYFVQFLNALGGTPATPAA